MRNPSIPCRTHSSGSSDLRRLSLWLLVDDLHSEQTREPGKVMGVGVGVGVGQWMSGGCSGLVGVGEWQWVGCSEWAVLINRTEQNSGDHQKR